MENKTKIALIADVISSKTIAEREMFQEILISILEEINAQFSEKIVSNLTITLGDEFQGLVTDAQTVLMIVDLIHLQLRLKTKAEIGTEILLRWGIGIGEMSTPILNQQQSIGSDGPAYWFARKAIEDIHQQNDYGKTNEKILTNFGQDERINSTIRLQNVIRNEWTLSQAETAYIVLKEFNYDQVNNRQLRISMNRVFKKEFSEQTVSKRIISTHIKQYTESRKLMAEELENWRQSNAH